MAKPVDGPPPLQRALDGADGLKPGTCKSVETLAVLAIEAKELPDGPRLLAAAHTCGRRSQARLLGEHPAVAWIAHADRMLYGEGDDATT